jgi:hypothetical protein
LKKGKFRFRYAIHNHSVKPSWSRKFDFFNFITQNCIRAFTT